LKPVVDLSCIAVKCTPKRMLQEPMPEGPAKGHVVELDQMLPEFYRLRGWDENGVPTDAKLAQLGLAR
jgi:aldehyde:ferredoxin oxidoreductase